MNRPALTRSRKRESGQTTVFMALFIATMVMLFAFTTNVGMFVHAKINLQNAADAAAYSGAAVQARQLTNVAYLNFEIRRSIKEFLYRYLVRGNKSQYCYPQLPTGEPVPGCFPFIPGNFQERFPFNLFDEREINIATGGTGQNEPFDGTLYLPTVCIVFDPQNNYCQKLQVAGLPEPPGGSYGVADALISQIRTRTNELRAQKVQDCEGRTFGNVRFLASWLFDIGHEPEAIAVTTADSAQAIEFAGLTGMGILPKVAMIRARINALEDTLNLNLASEGFSNGLVDEGTFGSMANQDAIRQDYFERPIQAYLSARNNLTTIAENGIFSDIRLTELLPNSPVGAASNAPFTKNAPILARFNELRAPFTVSYSHFARGVSQTAASGPAAGACDQTRVFYGIPNFLYGVYKDPEISTYYAVKLTAKAKLLFSPFNKGEGVTLTAYSAAKPFGSRVGKNLGADPERYMTAPAVVRTGDASVGINLHYFPNLLVSANTETTATAGFSTWAHLGYLRYIEEVANPAKAFRVAGAYSPWEIGFYTPVANFRSPTDISIFDGNPDFRLEPSGDVSYYMLRAPVINPTAGDNSLAFIRDMINSYLADESGPGIDTNGLLTQIKEGLFTDDNFADLFGWMEASGFNIAYPVLDPLLQDDPALLNTVIGINGARYTVAAMPQFQRLQLTSWNTDKTSAEVRPESELGTQGGRSGYSVRFVSFQQLAEGGQSSTDPDNPGSFANPFSRLGGGGGSTQTDLPKLRH